VYCVVSAYNRLSKKPKFYGIPVISIGNLLVGGTGKTPVTISLAKDKKDVCIVLRGYGRLSKGLVVVSKKGKILETVQNSGDEAMLLAQALPKATIIVSENRSKAVVKAKELGCKVVFLDDGYSKHELLKFDILLRPKDEPTNLFCLPSGGYRDTKMLYSFADVVLKEDLDFKREVNFSYNNKIVEYLPDNMILLTAISKPYRLLEFLPSSVKMVNFVDHYNFTQQDIDKIEAKYPNHNIITTQKDFVKLEKLKIRLDLYIMNLNVEVDQKIKDKIDSYIDEVYSGMNEG